MPAVAVVGIGHDDVGQDGFDLPLDDVFEVARVEPGEAAVGEVEDGEVDAEDVGDAFHLPLPPRTHLVHR